MGCVSFWWDQYCTYYRLIVHVGHINRYTFVHQFYFFGATHMLDPCMKGNLKTIIFPKQYKVLVSDLREIMMTHAEKVAVEECGWVPRLHKIF